MSAIALLDCFDRGAGVPLSAAEVVALSGLPRSSVFRELRALVAAGYVHHDPGAGRYSLGPRLLQLGMAARRQLGSEDLVAGPVLRLVGATGETVSFSLLDLPQRTCVYVVEAPSDLRQVVLAGASYPLHLGGAGKVILAELPAELARTVLVGYGLAEREIGQILAQLGGIRSAGYAFTSGERVPGASTIAAPVFVAGRIHGSVAAVGPTGRVAPTLERHRDLVVEAARSISEALSASGRSAPQQPERSGLRGRSKARGG